MARPYKELQDRMGPERQRQSRERAERDLLAMSLQELCRNMAQLTPAQVADLLGRSQAALRELERREDMALCSLAEDVSALGGQLEIRARFPGQPDIVVTRFEDVRGQLAGSTQDEKRDRSR